MLRRGVLLSVVVLLAACTGGVAATRAVTSAGSNLLFFATPLGVTVFDAHEHRTTASVLGGILAPDRSVVFGASIDGDGTVLSRYDPASGAARRVASIDGSHELRVANHDGSMVVFGPPRQESGPVYPVGRAITTLTIAKADGGARALDVIGNVEPEAFSNDDTNLFVVQYLPPENPVGYQVRRLDLSTGELHNVRTDDSDLDKPMAGRARTQVLSPDGTHLYTLYVVAGDQASGTPGYAFVHVLDLVAKQAHCIDLPAPFGTDGAAAYAIAVSPDGQRLFTADPNVGLLTELDTGSMAVSRTVAIPATQPPTAHAAVGAGRLFLGAGRDLVALDLGSLSFDSTALLDGSAAALITTSFDRDVYVALNNTIDVFDGNHISQGPLTTTRVPGAPRLIAADPVPPVDNRGPTECAC